MFEKALRIALLLSITAVPCLADGGLNLGRAPQMFDQINSHIGVVEDGDEFGRGLAVGDFDGDGYEDLALAAPFEDIGSAVDDAGQVGVMYGSIAGLGQGRPAQGFTQLTAGDLENGDQFGIAVVAGDFNGDGYDDLAVGIPFEDFNGVVDAGIVQVIYGSEAGLVEATMQTFTQSQAWGGGIETNDRFGEALAVGDFDHDDIDDLAIGTPYEDLSSDIDTGIFGVMYGSITGINTGRTSAWFSQESYGAGLDESGDHLGATLAAGDYNGDGFDDLAAGLPGEDAGHTDDGEVHVVYGSAAGLTNSGAQGFTQTQAGVGAAENVDRFGASLAAGDFDGDGIDDLAVGTPDEDAGSVYNTGTVGVLYGSPSKLTLGRPSIQLNESLYGTETGYNYFGFSIEAGDFDADGYDDLAIGVIGKDDGSVYNVGEVVVFYGSAAGVDRYVGIQQFDQLMLGLDTLEAYDEFGWSMAAGDFDGDLACDLTAASPREDLRDRVDAGCVVVLYGHDSLSSPGVPVVAQPMPLMLKQNAPNPFNPATTIVFELPESGAVSLVVYDARGRRVATLIDAVLDEGSHDVQWQGLDDRGQAVASGVYAYVLEGAGGQIQMKRMALVR